MSREFDARGTSTGLLLPATERTTTTTATNLTRYLAPRSAKASPATYATPAKDATYQARAEAHLKSLSPALISEPSLEHSFRIDPVAVTTSAGATAVHASQEYKGVLIFQASETVRFSPGGSLESSDGHHAEIAGDYSPIPKLGSVQAVVAAARFLSTPDPDEADATDQFGAPKHITPIDLSGLTPHIVSQEQGAERRTLLGAEALKNITSASLIWFPIDTNLHLAWQVVLILPSDEQWRVLVDAIDGRILYSHCLTLYVTAAANVYLRDPGIGRQLLYLPRPLTSYGLPIPAGLPAGFPRDWVAADRTEGNAVGAHLDTDGASTGGSVAAGVLTFNPADAAGDDQRVLNLFYFCNYMHDYLYLLGFREADGNYQMDNFGAGGLATDRVDARAFSGVVGGTANWSPDAVDGTTPVTNMGMFTSTNRHTALDSSVVFHECTHGLTTRLVGGIANTSSLDAIQSGSMGEGWSDYIACTINNSVVVGAWLTNSAGGIRGFPYDTNFPDDYGKLGTGRYNEIHRNGEIWCAALMEVNRNIGSTLAVQCVVDGLKLTPGNPTYLQARDAILSALRHKADVEKWSAIDRRNRLRGAWVAFAKFGMGVRAKSGPSSGVAGITADFSIPPELDVLGPWAADFVGSAYAEVLINRVSDGNWTLGTFNGAGQILLTPVGNTKGFGDLGDGGHLAWVGDFTGSGKSQILFNYVGDGNWWLGTVTGLQISFTRVGNTRGFGNLADGFHPSWIGDFTGSGKTQILFNYVGDGNWWLGAITNGQISFARVGNTLGFGNIADGGHPSWTGDFTGDGKADVMFNYVGDGNWWLGTFVNGQLLFARVGNTLGFGNLADGKHPSWVGNFTQTGSKQILFNYVGDGNWWLGTLANGQLTFAAVGNTLGFGDLADGKHPSWSADFTGRTNTEVLFNYVGDGNWWLGTFVNGKISFSNVANTVGFGDLTDGSHPSLTGNFTGSGKAEVLFNYYGDGNWWLGSFATGSLVFTKAGTTA